MWARGDGRKTLLWLRQAAETARGDALDARANALAQVATEFERLGLGETTASGSFPGVGAPAAAAPQPVAAAPAPPPTSPASPRPAAPPTPGRRKLAATAPYDLAQTRLEAPPPT